MKLKKRGGGGNCVSRATVAKAS